MEDCHMWGIYEVKTKGTANCLIFQSYNCAGYTLAFFFAILLLIWNEFVSFLLFFTLLLSSLGIYFNRHALVEWPAILSTVSATLAETMNGLIGINHLRDIGWKRWLLYLVILMNLGPGIKNAKDKRGIR